MGRALTDSDKSPQNLVLDRNMIDKVRSFSCVYHSDEDTLFFRPEKPKPATSFDWNGELWFRIDLQTGELVGIEIENFESVFLKKYPEIAPVWKEYKSSFTHRLKLKENENLWDAFIRIILEFLTELFENKPQQLVLKETPS